MNIHVSDQAREDLVEVWSYINDRSPAAADRTVEALVASYRSLLDNPLKGRSRDDLLPGVRTSWWGNISSSTEWERKLSRCFASFTGCGTLRRSFLWKTRPRNSLPWSELPATEDTKSAYADSEHDPGSIGSAALVQLERAHVSIKGRQTVLTR